MNIGIINALPMSLIAQKTTLNPNVTKEVLQEILHPEDWANGDLEIMWLWGHKNTSEQAAHFLYEQFGVVERWAGFGDRPTVYVKDGEFFAKTVLGNEFRIDRLIVLAPIFASNERKAEGVVAQASEVVGFRPILVETH